MRRFAMAYGVWCKRHMIRWYLEGIAAHARDASALMFFFDGCVDGSEDEFDAVAAELLPGMKIVKGRSVGEVDELAQHNELMRMLLHETTCDAMIVFQDDMLLTRAIHHDVDKLMNQYGNSLGYVAGRDGYEVNHGDFASSEWSESVLAEVRLKPGEHLVRSSLNIGPVVYTRNVINLVGFNDPDFIHAWWYDDYCARCKHDAGLTNVLLGTGVIHKKWGETPAGGTWTKHYGDAVADAHDREVLHEKWRRIGW